MNTHYRCVSVFLLALLSSTWLLAQIRIPSYDLDDVHYQSWKQSSGKYLENRPHSNGDISWGYYLLQVVSSYNMTAWGAISTATEADSIVHVLKEHSVSGVQYSSSYYHPQDITACITIANVFKNAGIDLWLTSAGLQKCMRAFNGDAFPSQYRAYSMTPDGTIVPASVYSLGASEKVPAFDSMNPEAMNWFLDRYKQIFLVPLAPYTSGYFFDEDCLYYGIEPGHPNNRRTDYWELPAYSDAVLEAWQQYCRDHSVTFNSEVVTHFPVHSPSMEANGAGKTQYFPGYNVPYEIESWTQLISVPRNTGVWAAWDDFVTSQFVETWIGGISKAVSDVNSSNPDFKGVLYFALHWWGLGYEEVDDPNFFVDPYHKWVPWGTQRGVRLNKICALPYLDHIICETYPPIHANLYRYISTYKQFIKTHDKTFGLMLHRDDNWGLDQSDTENDRWEAIYYFQPEIIARYPVNRLFPADQYYDGSKENAFDERLREYRQSGVIADFSASPTSGMAPLIVQFTDQSTGEITGREWDFGDDETSTATNPSHLYPYPGIYTVKLTVAGTGGPDTKIRIDYIEVTSNPENMLLNGDYSDGTNYWLLWTEPAASASSAVQNGEYVVSIANGGSHTYDIQLFQLKLRIENGKTYDVSFDAYATAPRPITSQVAMASAPWSGYVNQTVTLGTVKQTYSYLFTMDFPSDPDARIVFELGNSTADVYLDNIILKQGSSLVQEPLADSRTPESFVLYQNYPNPFNPHAHIDYQLAARSFVKLNIFNVQGQTIRTLVSEEQDKGTYSACWDGRDSHGEYVPSAVYIYHLEAKNAVFSKKMILIK